MRVSDCGTQKYILNVNLYRARRLICFSPRYIPTKFKRRCETVDLNTRCDGPGPSCVKNRSPSCSLSLMWLEFAKQTRAYSSEKSYQPPCHVHYDNTVNLIIIVYIARREKVFSAQYFFEAWCYLESAPKTRGSRTGCTREAFLNMDVNNAVPVECLCVDALS